jgi:hypothetical protein
MAVRNDFTAGEVLAAADLNDTFASKLDYPAGGADGDALIKDGTSAVWGAPIVAGLTLITAETFSAVSSVSVNSCFNSTYENYFILASTKITTGTDQDLRLRLRLSGADNTTASSYRRQEIRASGSAVSGSQTSSDRLTLGRLEENRNNSMWLYIYKPAVADFTAFLGATGVTNTSTTMQVSQNFGQHEQSVAYDGFTLFPQTSTISGFLTVYGVAK